MGRGEGQELSNFLKLSSNNGVPWVRQVSKGLPLSLYSSFGIPMEVHPLGASDCSPLA